MTSRAWQFVVLWAALEAVSAAQTVKVTSGVTDYQVFQRDNTGRATVAIAGTAEGAEGRPVEARLTRADGADAAWRGWKSIGNVTGGRWQGSLAGITAGGPYTLLLRVAGTAAQPTAIDHILVGDLWLLAGQSNMEGVGDLVDVEPPSPVVNSFDQSDQWVLAVEPLHALPIAADRVHWRLNANKQPERLEGEARTNYINGRKKGAGLALAFAKKYAATNNVPVGIVPCAHGGTSMTQWSPADRDKGGDSLYGAMLRRFRAVGGKVRGVLWYQGESDANDKDAPLFQKKFEDFVAAVRQDFGDPALPFLYVQIGRHINSGAPKPWNAVQQAQLASESRLTNAVMVSSINSTLDDGIHVSTPDLRRLGAQMADLVCRTNSPCVEPKKGPRPLYARKEGSLVRVAFEEVNGGLQGESRISGFTIVDGQGALVPAIYKVRVDPNDPNSILLSFQGTLPAGAAVEYGLGRDPYCNLMDKRGYAAPVFGPLPIQQ